jgi:hypothetical protein
MSSWSPVERAYSLWLRAAREHRSSAAALGRALETYIRKAYRLPLDADLREIGVETELTGRTIGRWEKGTLEKPQPQYPSDSWSREALIAVVTDLVPNPPVEMEWASFQDVCEQFAADRLERIERGSAVLESHASGERNKERHQFLAAWPAPAHGIDPLELGLGSWAFDGALPPYLHRTTDKDLVLRLKEPGITTVSGAPKSGKSRSILETVQRQHPAGLTWWVNPSPTVLPLVVENAKKTKGSEKPGVIVLDDAGLIGTDPTTGLTAQRLADLAKACKHLIVVIHTQTLADWEHQLTDRTPGDLTSGGIGATRKLMDMLGYRIRYDSVLDDEETTPAAETYENANERVKSFDLTRLAETLSGVEMLKKQALKLLETPASVEAALLEAAIDASIAFPSGATEDVLAALATEHHKRRQPNRPWRSARFDDALDTLTTGITGGSPHALLIAGNSGTFRLFDALVPELQGSRRNLSKFLRKSHLSQAALHEGVSAAARWHFQRDLLELSGSDPVRRLSRACIREVWRYSQGLMDAEEFDLWRILWAFEKNENALCQVLGTEAQVSAFFESFMARINEYDLEDGAPAFFSLRLASALSSFNGVPAAQVGRNMALVPRAAQQARLVIRARGYAPYVFWAAAGAIVKDAIWLDRAQAPALVSSLGRDERLRREMAISCGDLRLAESAALLRKWSNYACVEDKIILETQADRACSPES